MKKFIILSQPRSGSTLLNECLMQHPDLNMFGEIFNYCRRSNLFANQEGSEILTYKEMKSHCYRENCIKAHSEYNGFKVLCCHIQNDVHSYIEESLNILLHRRNLLARYVSHVVAAKTEVWEAKKIYNGTIHIEPELAEKDIHNIIHSYKKYDVFSSLNLYYEDSIFENVNKACELLNIKPFTPLITSVKRIDKPLEEVIINYDEVKHLDHTAHF